jgi:WD40 repeat protein
LAVLSDHVLVRIVRTTDGDKEAQFNGSPSSGLTPWWSSQVTWLDHGSKLLLCGGASPVQLRERGGDLIREIEIDKTAVSSVNALDPVSPRFAVGDTNGNVVICSTTKGEVIAGPYHVPKPVNSLAFDPQGRTLAVGGGDCRVRMIDLHGDAQMVTLSHCDEDIFGGLAIGCVAFDPEGKRLVSTSFSFHEVRLWDLKSNELIWKFDFSGGNEGGVSAHFTEDGSAVFTSRGGGLHAVQDGKSIHTLGPDGLMPADNFRWDRDRAWNQVDGVLNVFDVPSGKRLSQIQLARSR